MQPPHIGMREDLLHNYTTCKFFNFFIRLRILPYYRIPYYRITGDIIYITVLVLLPRTLYILYIKGTVCTIV